MPMTALEYARKYKAMGLAPLPVPLLEKACKLKGWQNLIIEERELAERFEEDGNIGILLGDASGGLVDIDLDCPEALRIASDLLPATEMIFGREGNPSSHWLYKLDQPGRKIAYVDPTDGDTLVEYRSNGCMTVFPGSIHESGEDVEFVRDGDPARVDKEDLQRRVAHLAAASLLARHWPKGNRHNSTLALAGCLFQGGLDASIVEMFVRGVCLAANDLEESEDRLTCVRTTQIRFQRGEPIAGWSAFNEAFDPAIAAKIREWLTLRIPQEVIRPGDRQLQPKGTALRFADLDNAERFRSDHAARAGYCHELQSWFFFDGRRWAKDTDAAVQRLAMETARQLGVEAAETGPGQYLLLAYRAQSNRAIQDMLKLAQNWMSVPEAAFDRDPYLFNCQNGTIDLRTGSLRPHNPQDKISKLAHVDFIPEAECPTLMAFLNRIMAGNERLISYLQRAFGYSLTGSTDEQCLFLMLGSGANGKSTLLRTIRSLMGEYAQQTPVDTLMAKASSNVSNDLARLKGARFVSATEAEAGQRLAEAKIKHMTGGDPVAARFLYREYFEFTPQFKLWLATNELPRIDGVDEGTWRRIKVIPFSVTIPPEERDHTLAERLEAELPGILNWVLQGCLKWQREGLQAPDEVSGATREYRSDMDLIAQFIEDACVLEAKAQTTAKELYVNYVEWCSSNGHESLKQNTFGQRLKARGLKQVRTRKARGWVGIRLATPEDDLMDSE